MQYLSSRDIYKSFSLMSSVTLLTIILGVITTKIAAIFGGLEIIGKLELYRKLIGLIVPILAAGSSAIIVQRISNASSEKNISNVLSSTSSLFLVQMAVLLFLAIMFADEIAVWLFSAEYKTLKGTIEMRIVILMSIAVLSLQTLTAIINGKVNLKEVNIVHVATALTTMIACYPLLMLGDLGVALLVGFGSVVGSFIAFFYVLKIYKKQISFIRLSIRDFFSSSPTSIWMIAHPLIVSTLLLYIPVMVQNQYGLKSLGLYSSVIMINTIITIILMSALKTYFLPTLGKIKSVKEKKIYINKIIFLLLIAMLPIIIVIMFFAKIILLILYSAEFVIASELLIIQMMSLLSAAFCWPYANYILHNGHYKIYFLIDSIWAIFLALLIWFFVGNNYQLSIVPILFVVGGFVSTSLYTFTVSRMYGEGMLSRQNLRLGLYFIIIILLTYVAISQFNLYIQSFWAIIIAIGFVVFLRRNHVKNLLEK